MTTGIVARMTGFAVTTWIVVKMTEFAVTTWIVENMTRIAVTTGIVANMTETSRLGQFRLFSFFGAVYSAVYSPLVSFILAVSSTQTSSHVMSLSQPEQLPCGACATPH